MRFLGARTLKSVFNVTRQKGKERGSDRAFTARPEGEISRHFGDGNGVEGCRDDGASATTSQGIQGRGLTRVSVVGRHAGLRDPGSRRQLLAVARRYESLLQRRMRVLRRAVIEHPSKGERPPTGDYWHDGHAPCASARGVRVAVITSASAIVLMHNHPSGDPTPSEGDIKTTRDLIRAGQLMKIDVLDHVIMGNPNRCSLRELGYFYQ